MEGMEVDGCSCSWMEKSRSSIWENESVGVWLYISLGEEKLMRSVCISVVYH